MVGEFSAAPPGPDPPGWRPDASIGGSCRIYRRMSPHWLDFSYDLHLIVAGSCLLRKFQRESMKLVEVGSEDAEAASGSEGLSSPR